ncbi:MAG: MFS transporter [Parasphingorhabdus sp.]|uniref:MFS transporter n=2 Tax=Parasphingorhabdus sp. TaxID=2709688 RepID=UPI0032658C39
MTDQAMASAVRQKPSLWTKIAYGFGSVAYGTKDAGLKYFLLLFYSQVVGMDPRLVSLAILIALVFDALSDPIVGYWSDNFRSRWGRRHPFMYAAAIPVALSYYFIWIPPAGWSDQALFWYVVILAITIRTFITIYETPSTALAAELTDDYDERSSILSFRGFFGWFGGNAMTVVAFSLIFPAFVTVAIKDGQFNPDAYAFYGLMGSLVMFAAIVISAIGTHQHIPKLRQAPPKRDMTMTMIFREIYQTVASGSFFALFVASLLRFAASGFAAGLTFYFSIYFWGFTAEEIGLITLGVFLSAIIGGLLAPFVTRTLGKKRGALAVGFVGFIGLPLPIFLRLIDVLPENGTPEIFWIVAITNTLDVGLIICFQVLATSMMADLVEQGEVKTGNRSEGLFFAAATFMRKFGEGFGIVIAGFVLSVVGVAAGATQGELSDEILWKLGAVYVPVILAMLLTVLVIISFYKVDRAKHDATVKELAARKASP